MKTDFSVKSAPWDRDHLTGPVLSGVEWIEKSVTTINFTLCILLGASSAGSKHLLSIRLVYRTDEHCILQVKILMSDLREFRKGRRAAVFMLFTCIVGAPLLGATAAGAIQPTVFLFFLFLFWAILYVWCAFKIDTMRCPQCGLPLVRRAPFWGATLTRCPTCGFRMWGKHTRG